MQGRKKKENNNRPPMFVQFSGIVLAVYIRVMKLILLCSEQREWRLLLLLLVIIMHAVAFVNYPTTAASVVILVPGLEEEEGKISAITSFSISRGWWFFKTTG